MKRILALILSLAMTTMLFTSCGSSSPEEPAVEAESSQATGGERRDIRLALVLHALNSSFFVTIQDGAIAAGEDLNITVDVMAPTLPNSLAEQVAMIESCIAAGYDGIATTLWDPDGFNDVIRRAQDAGIIFVGINQDSPDSGRSVFIGQDMEPGGYTLGRYMFETVMGGSGRFIITSCAPANTALIERAEGIMRAAQEFPDIEFVDLIDIGVDLTGAVGIIENAYLANPDVDAFIGVDVYSEAIGTFIATQGLQGQLFGGGFDLTEGTLAHIRDNAMQITIGQNPFLQGWYPMINMYQHIVHGFDLLDIDTGAFMVTEHNVERVNPE
jgi:ABC-type sugar transport system substrate-binding protein